MSDQGAWAPPTDQSQPSILSPGQWEPVISRPLQLHLTPFMLARPWSDANKWKTPGSLWP